MKWIVCFFINFLIHLKDWKDYPDTIIARQCIPLEFATKTHTMCSGQGQFVSVWVSAQVTQRNLLRYFQCRCSWAGCVSWMWKKAPDPMVFYSETINYAWFHLVLLYGLRLYVFYLPPIDGEEWDGNELQPRQRYFLVVVVVCRIYDHFERMNYFGARLRWRIYAVAVALLTTSAPRALAYLFNNSRWRRRREHYYLSFCWSCCHRRSAPSMWVHGHIAIHAIIEKICQDKSLLEAYNFALKWISSDIS